MPKRLRVAIVAAYCSRNDAAGSAVQPTVCSRVKESVMGKGLILWLLGVPGVVVILLLVTHVI
jgi:hypothetical protein